MNHFSFKKVVDYQSFCKFALTDGWGRATIHSPWNLIVNLRKLKKWMEKNAHRVLHSNKNPSISTPSIVDN